MKCALMSDLHLEWDTPVPELPDSDVLLLAGDIISLSKRVLVSNNDDTLCALNFYELIARAASKYKHVIFVPGNHEYYFTTFGNAQDRLTDLFSKYTNCYWLNNQSVVLDGIKFIGSTLWSDYLKMNPLAVLEIQRGINDYRAISNNDWSAVTVEQLYQTHVDSVEWIKSELANTTHRSVCVTHYAPSHRSVPPQYTGELTNGAFCSDLEDIMLNSPHLLVWAHGHTHWGVDYHIGNCRVVSNPHGSSFESKHCGWDQKFTFEI